MGNQKDEWAYTIGDERLTLEEICNILLANGAEPLAIIEALKATTSDKEWNDILLAFRSYYVLSVWELLR